MTVVDQAKREAVSHEDVEIIGQRLRVVGSSTWRPAGTLVVRLSLILAPTEPLWYAPSLQTLLDEVTSGGWDGWHATEPAEHHIMTHVNSRLYPSRRIYRLEPATTGRVWEGTDNANIQKLREANVTEEFFAVEMRPERPANAKDLASDFVSVPPEYDDVLGANRIAGYIERLGNALPPPNDTVSIRDPTDRLW